MGEIKVFNTIEQWLKKYKRAVRTQHFQSEQNNICCQVERVKILSLINNSQTEKFSIWIEIRTFHLNSRNEVYFVKKNEFEQALFA